MNLLMCGTVLAGTFVTTSAVARGQDMNPLPIAIYAQQVSQETAQNKNPSSTESKVTVTLKDTPIYEALDAVAKISGTRITYSKSIVPEDRRVSLTANEAPLEGVLRRILEGTKTEAQRTLDNQIVIAKQKYDKGTRSGTITGRVVNAKTQQPVSGATVSLADGSAKVVTGVDGRFVLPVPAGEQSIQVRAVGYVRQGKQAVVQENGSVSLDIALEPSASVLDEVVVTGTIVATERRAIANPITVITAEEIERRGITRVEQLLRGEVPGVFAVERGTVAYDAGIMGITRQDFVKTGEMVKSDVYTRGASTFNTNDLNQGGAPQASAPLKTFVDGVELADASYLGTIDPQSIERIEIITGPQAATVYGSAAMGGVMQIFTKGGQLGSPPQITLGFGYGILQSNASSGLTPVQNHKIGMTGSTGGQLAYSANVRYQYDGQWQPRLFRSVVTGSAGVTHTARALTISGSVNVMSSRNGTTAFDLGPLILKKMEQGDILPSQNGGTGDNGDTRVAENASQSISLTIDHKIAPQIAQKLTIGRSQNHFANIPLAPLFGTPSDTMYAASSSTGVKNSGTYYITARVQPNDGFSSTATAGVNISTGTRTRLAGCLSKKSDMAYVPCVASTSTTRAVNGFEGTDDSRGGFVQWQGGFFNHFYVTLGLRGEKNDAYGRDHRIDWTPSNGLTYVFEYDELTVKFLGSYGRATRAPDLRLKEEVISNVTGYDIPFYVSQQKNEALRPERARGPQGGVEIYLGNRGGLTVNHYSERVADLLESVVVDTAYLLYLGNNTIYPNPISQWQNVGVITRKGWETTGTLNAGIFSFKGTYSWNDSRIKKAYSSSLTEGSTFRGIPTHTGYLQIHAAHGPTAVTLSTNFIGSIPGATRMHWYYWEFSWSRINTYIDRFKSWPEITRTSGYAKSDLNVSHRVNPWTTIELNVVNLGNSFQADIASFQPSLGRKTMIGVSLRQPNR